MVEGGGDTGIGSGSRSKPASSFESAGGRLRFTVELRPGETTIVSWKKLLREANSNKANGPGTSVSGPSSEAHEQPPLPPAPPLNSKPKQHAENDANDPEAQAGPNRLSNVIERIERMYAGNGSSDEEDVVLDDVPDDDEYDTEDSFIDDTELDDYFQVDNSAIKHDGFFVNRGKLERIEPTISMIPQPKKRRRKDMAKGHGGSDDGHTMNKHVKIGNKGGKASSAMERKSNNQLLRVAVPNLHGDEFQASPANATEVSLIKKTAGTKMTVDPSGLSVGDVIRLDKYTDLHKTELHPSKNHNNKRERSELQDTSTQRSKNMSSHLSKSHSGKQLSNADELDQSGVSVGDVIRLDKYTDLHKTELHPSKNHNNKRGRSELQDTSTQRSKNKSSHLSKSHSGKQLSNANELDQSIQRKEKGRLVAKFDLNVPPTRESMLDTKVPLIPKKDGSTVRPKSSILDKAIRELAKTVAESRPPSTEVQVPDSSSQAVKRRLTPEIKEKLAKVARLAQTSYGKIPMDVVNRLMSIVGHLMQVRTLKRNLRVMANMGMSAKQEKDDQVLKIKQEIAEMVKLQIPYMKSKLDQPTASSDDFEECGPEEKEALKRRYSMDDALENKICDLYDLYVERLQEDSGPPVRKLYEELAALWPSGVMDTDGVRRAIYRAKDRRRALGNRQKDQQKIQMRKVVAPKAEDSSRGKAISRAGPMLAVDPRRNVKLGPYSTKK